MRFIEDPVRRKVRCGVCGEKLRRGAISLILLRDGKLIKRVCGVDCMMAYEQKALEQRLDEEYGCYTV